MATDQINLYKKQIRQANNSKKRQALFIAEYVQVKYFEIYQEAAGLYNKINAMYPKKPDSRKSVEFKNWKLVESGMPKMRPHVPRDPTEQCVYEGIAIPQKETIQEIVASVPKKAFQLRIPLMNAQHISELNNDGGQQASDEDQQASDQGIDEVLDEGEQAGEKRYEVDDIQPSVFGDIPGETVAEIMKQLREDDDIRSHHG